MRVHSLFFLLSLLLAVVSNCSAEDKTFEVVGTAECADCKDNNFKTSQAFAGIGVTIDCKVKNSQEIKRVGASELDKEGKFSIKLAKDIVQDGQSPMEECYAQLHSSAAVPCPAHNGLEAAKIVFKSKTTDGKHTFGPAKNLAFSSALCTSKFFGPYFKYPPLPKYHKWKKHFPKVSFPPLKDFGHPFPLPPFPYYKPKPIPPPLPIYKPKPIPPPVPIYKPKPKPELPLIKPLPPLVPIYKPKPEPPVVKPLPPPVPIYKPKHKLPIVKPLPPPVPIYKPKPKPYPPVYKPKPKPPVYKPKPTPLVVKPLPPPVPIYKPPIVKPLPPPIPFYKPPVVVVTKPLPPPIPLFPLPPFYKKPFPPVLPPFPKLPPKDFHHPKFGWPPLPPSIPHP